MISSADATGLMQTVGLPIGSNAEVAADVTQVTHGANGSPQAFALSLADVTRLSGEGLGFPNPSTCLCPQQLVGGYVLLRLTRLLGV